MSKTTANYAVGDTVQLQSGGPHMTVVDTTVLPEGSGNAGQTACVCAYFDDTNVAHQMNVLPAALRNPSVFSGSSASSLSSSH